MATTWWSSSKAISIAERAGMKALKKASEATILRKAVQEAPKRPPPIGGTLRASASVHEDAARKAVHISFNTPYAAKQHEELGYHHSVGKAKYLEDPFRAGTAQVVKYVQLEVNKALREGGKW